MSRAASIRNTCCRARPTSAAYMSTTQRTPARFGSAATTAHRLSRSNRSTKSSAGWQSIRRHRRLLRFLAPKARAILNTVTHGQVTFKIQLNREASVKTNMFVALLLASALTVGTAAAQPAPFNQIGVTMGHWHIASKDVEANKKLFLAMGGKLFMPGGNPLIMYNLPPMARKSFLFASTSFEAM